MNHKNKIPEKTMNNLNNHTSVKKAANNLKPLNNFNHSTIKQEENTTKMATNYTNNSDQKLEPKQENTTNSIIKPIVELPAAKKEMQLNPTKKINHKKNLKWLENETDFFNQQFKKVNKLFKELQHLKSIHEDLLAKQKQAELDLEAKVKEYQEAKRIFNSGKFKKI